MVFSSCGKTKTTIFIKSSSNNYFWGQRNVQAPSLSEHLFLVFLFYHLSFTTLYTKAKTTEKEIQTDKFSLCIPN